jgi:hypothetical protein
MGIHSKIFTPRAREGKKTMMSFAGIEKLLAKYAKEREEMKLHLKEIEEYLSGLGVSLEEDKNERNG